MNIGWVIMSLWRLIFFFLHIFCYFPTWSISAPWTLIDFKFKMWLYCDNKSITPKEINCGFEPVWPLLCKKKSAICAFMCIIIIELKLFHQIKTTPLNLNHFHLSLTNTQTDIYKHKHFYFKASRWKLQSCFLLSQS